MKRALVAVVVIGCGQSGNPDVLWVGPSDNGQGITLTEHEPFQY